MFYNFFFSERREEQRERATQQDLLFADLILQACSVAVELEFKSEVEGQFSSLIAIVI